MKLKLALLTVLAATAATLPGASGRQAGDAALLVRWPAHEGAGGIVRDNSGNGLDGLATAGWTNIGDIKALFFDGESKSIVRAQIPPGKCLGAGDWSFMAWLRPEILDFPGKQNKRRFFSYGKTPEAGIILDLTGAGNLTWDFLYKDSAGKSAPVGGQSAPRLKTGIWIHAALVVDRRQGRVRVYLNGCESAGGNLPVEWNADFSLGNELTLGSSWQNYHGAMADVAVWRRALSAAEVNAAFRAQNMTYGLKLGKGLTLEERLAGLVEEGDSDMARKNTGEARAAFGKILSASGVSSSWAAWAELRIAQSQRLDGQNALAGTTCDRIQKNASYPSHYRQEASELLLEMQRLARGLPARDIMASRTTVPPIEHFAAQIWMAPNGDDAHPGTAELPVATLQRARDLVRAARSRVKGPVAVILRSGEYPLQASLTLTGEDSGSPGAPVVWMAQEPGKAVLYGGTRLKEFAPVTDPAILERLPAEARGKVVQYNLKAAGITNYGALSVRGFRQPRASPTVEFYVNQQPMTLARWPNEGFVRATKVVEPGNKKAGKPSVLGYDNDRPARWTRATDAWIFGYFHFLWADATAKIARIDTTAKTLTTAEAYNCFGGGMTNEQGILYYAFNLLEEIDRPGEWYLDRATGKLYLYPPCDLTRATVEISLLSQPMIWAANLAHVRFEGLVFDLARDDGIVLKESSDCLLAGCTVRRMAGDGIRILGGERDTLLSCDVHTIGRCAMEVIGGDRATLRPGGHTVANCRIHHFGRIDRTYTPGVQLEGVGGRLAHNLFYDCPSSAVRIEGNDHLIEYNEVHHAVLESDDQGSMELYGNPTYRGVIFQYNLFHDIGSGAARKLVAGQAGIRFDDVISGMLVYGNIFYRAANGAFGGVNINGGRDNVVDNNIFVDCKHGVSGGYYAKNVFWKRLREGQEPADFYTNALYQQRYPEMVRLLAEPVVNHVSRNIFYRCGPEFSGWRWGPGNDNTVLDQFANSIFADQDPGFVDAARGNLRLKTDAPVVNSIGFRPIPVDEIGLYQDQWRPEQAIAKMTPSVRP